MNIKQERVDFETWYKHHHGDRDVYALDEFGEYVDKQVHGAFNVWQARAALHAQDRADAERYRWIRDEDGLMVLPYDDHGLGPEFPCGSDLDKAIDLARAIEQAVLQSPEIQELKKDAERYRWLRDSGNDYIGVVSGLGCTDSGSSNVVGTYEYILDGEQLDSDIDRAMSIVGGKDAISMD